MRLPRWTRNRSTDRLTIDNLDNNRGSVIGSNGDGNSLRIFTWLLSTVGLLWWKVVTVGGRIVKGDDFKFLFLRHFLFDGQSDEKTRIRRFLQVDDKVEVKSG